MADVSITREAVEAAARALVHAGVVPGKGWEDLQPGAQFLWIQRAKTALAAAAPLIVAVELERQISVAVEYGKSCPCPGADEPGVNCTNRFHFEAARVIKRVRIRLDELRTQS